MTAPATKKPSLASREPVYVGAFVTWLFSVAGTFILGHTSLIDGATWSGLATTLVPIVTAALLGLISTVIRKYVTPFYNNTRKQLQKTLGLSDEQVEKLEDYVENQLVEAGDQFTNQTFKQALGHETSPSGLAQV